MKFRGARARARRPQKPQKRHTGPLSLPRLSARHETRIIIIIIVTSRERVTAHRGAVLIEEVADGKAGHCFASLSGIRPVDFSRRDHRLSDHRFGKSARVYQ